MSGKFRITRRDLLFGSIGSVAAGTVGFRFWPHKPDHVQFSAMYSWLRGRQLEGSYPGIEGPGIGSWPTSGMRVSRGWGMLEEKHWPYDGDPNNWPPKEPKFADELAKRYRTGPYIRIRNARDCEKALLTSTGAVNASFTIVADDWYKASSGHIQMPAKGATPSVGHCVAIMPYPETRRRFLFANSWGTDWGENGWGYMSHESFDRYMTDAWFLAGNFGTPPAPEKCSAIQLVDWYYEDALGRPNLGAELFDYDKDERIGWWFAVDLKPNFEVEDFFVMPSYRRQGHGTRLMEKLLDVRNYINRSIDIWIAHPDWNANQHPASRAFLKKFGFEITKSGNNWAVGKATLA